MRELKSSGAAKDVWQPEVNILLDLKKKLEAAQKKSVTSDGAPVANGTANADTSTIKQIEEELNKQVSNASI